MASEDLSGVHTGGLGKHVVNLGNALRALGRDVANLGRNGGGAQYCAAQIGFQGRFIACFDWRRPGWKEAQLGLPKLLECHAEPA
ncbi:hypothetical protein [Massilia psychrophila]|nr:hypothetical protein [Massilia psychrophila]GGE67373.1 hypothetical protein GCM10008020_09700 [Massilia psychrophila]